MSPRPGRIVVSSLLVSLVAAGFAGGAGADSLHPTDDLPVLQIGKATVLFAQVSEPIQAKLTAMQKQYDAKLRDLALNDARARSAFLEAEFNKSLGDRVLSLEAGAKNTTPEALLQTVKPDPVTDPQMHAFYDSQSVQIGQPFETVAPQLRQYLDNEAAKAARRQFIDGLRRQYAAFVTWEPLREQVDPIGPRRGPDAAPVTIVEFSDFECPFCGRFTPELQRVLAAYPKQVRLVFRNYPLRSIHPNAEKAAEAGVCAKLQGKFWEMHDVMFAEQNALSVGALKEKAKRLGLDSAAFNKCLDGGEGVSAVQTDGETGEQLGLGSTPISFINGRFMSGALSFDEVSEIVDDELRRVTARKSRR